MESGSEWTRRRWLVVDLMGALSSLCDSDMHVHDYAMHVKVKKKTDKASVGSID
jgi:hypothetical protein